jgi:predicted ribosome quality control (RQC) complex YloA/Tae2 family protein
MKKLQPIDALTLQHLAVELAGLMTGTQINKVQHLSHTEFLLHTWGGAFRKFYLNVSPENPVCFFCDGTDFIRREFTQPTGLCMLLRKHLVGSRIVRVDSQPGERVLNITVSILNEWGEPVERLLSFELMGKHTNLLLVGDGVILGAAHAVSESMSRFREIRANLPYAPPPKTDHKRLLADVSDAELLAILHAEGFLALPQHVQGLGRDMLNSLLDPQADPATWLAILRDVDAGRGLRPAISPQGFSLKPFADEGWQFQSTVHTMVANYFQPRLQERVVGKVRNQLLKTVETQITRLTQQQPDAHTETEASPWQAWGDLLLLEAHLPIPPTAEAVTVVDPATEQPVSIPVDPMLSRVDNAQKYFKRVQKERARSRSQAERGAMLATEQARWENLGQLVAQADDLETLSALRQEIQPEPTHGKPAKEPTGGLLKLTTPDGWEVWIGKTGTANAQLCGKLAKPWDVWLHTHQMPGSHVLIRRPDRSQPVPDATLLAAAQWAAYFSAGRQSTKVPVVYTEARFVRKIPDSYPGHVNYREETLVVVEPQAPEAPVET